LEAGKVTNNNIDSTAFIEKMTEFSAYRYENGWISAETIGCWEEKVDAIIEQQAEVMGIDYNSLDDATKEELREQSIICADLEDKLINVYLSNRKTASDEFNEFWDEIMLGAGVACALMFLVTPAGVAEFATFTIGIADGTKKIWQGDTAEGVTEIGISVIGEIAYVAKEVSAGRKVAKLMDGATGAVDDLDFAIDASKFDDLEYIKANPLSENYYLSDEEIRYRQFWRRVEEGRNVMPEDEYAKWMYSDSKVCDYLTIEEVDYDDILSLRKSEQMSQTIDDTASVKKIIASEGGKETELFLSDEYYKKIDENIAKAIEARDAEVTRIQGLSKAQQSKIATVVGGLDIRTGEVYVGVKNSKIYAGNASCAEDIVFRGLGGNTNANIIMTPAVRPRTGEIIPVCTRCQTKYPVNQFVKGTTFQ